MGIKDIEFYGYDLLIELPDDDKFIKNTFFLFYKKGKDGKNTKKIEDKIFKIREDKSWWNFPNY